ncbi:DUF7144 family membrane protein [Streptomyces mesophilus]|uniref:DUF7144 family membrane protein n=1 Tax=Streptomyces mesophilus TaxID=1775132 RepID=UPI003324DA99
MARDAVPPGTGEGNPRPWHAAASGTTVLAATLMIIGGAMAALEGSAALADDDLFLVTRHYVFEFSLAGWGWVHLVLGIAMVVAGCALFGGALWARFFGVFVAGLSAIANFLWVPYYPLWALTLVAVNLFVVWALCTGMHKEAHAE